MTIRAANPATTPRAATAAASPKSPASADPTTTAASWAGRVSARCVAPPAAHWRWTRAGWR